ncbi:MAG: VOC family protein, partial [Planctomycetes bacterium]|nr:VOC family protein [Planctomycetota bacterium]
MEVALNIPDEAEAERVYAALLEGGTAKMPLQ